MIKKLFFFFTCRCDPMILEELGFCRMPSILGNQHFTRHFLKRKQNTNTQQTSPQQTHKDIYYIIGL